MLRALSAAYKYVLIDQLRREIVNDVFFRLSSLCSIGSSAIVLALEYSNAPRTDLVGLFPYASHCVIDAVERIGTLLSGPSSFDANLRIVYNQYGYVQKKISINIVEDCVDNLFRKETDLFPGG